VWIARHLTRNVCVSQAIQRSIGCDGAVIPNLYENGKFRPLDRKRDKELLFVGRLVSEKGIHVLLDAMHELKRQGVKPSLTIIGGGPEQANIEKQIQQLGLADQVALCGRQDQVQIAQWLNEHKILVIPSVCEEGFGIVALEGAACGCVVVGSSGGGLPEAIGPCGVTSPTGDHQRLAAILGELLANPEKLHEFRRAAPAHLADHRAEIVAAKYLDFFEHVLELDARRRPALSDCRLITHAKSEHLESHVR
jgi:glycosyltransferase involved in cell wall biosynthesis